MIDLNEITKQARAEVLAAYVKHACYGCKSGWPAWKEGNSWWHPFDKTRGAGVAEDCKASWLRELQPAAKDLEELLQKERLKVTESSPERWHFNTETRDGFMKRYFAWRKKNLESFPSRLK